MQILTGLGTKPVALAFAPDGRYLVAEDDREYHLWDPVAGPTPVWSARHKRTSAQSFGFAPDGRSVVGLRNGTLGRYDVSTGKGTDDVHLAGLNGATFSPGGRLACGTASAMVTASEGVAVLLCFRAAANGTWAEAWRKKYHWNDGARAALSGVMFSADSARLARFCDLGSDRRVIEMSTEVFESESGALAAQWQGELPNEWVTGMSDDVRMRMAAVGPTGAVVFLQTHALYAIDTNDPNAQPVKRAHETRYFTSAAISRDGARLVTTASNDTAATLWNTTTWEVVRQYEWKIGCLRSVCFAPDGLRCAACGDTGQVVVWDLDE